MSNTAVNVSAIFGADFKSGPVESKQLPEGTFNVYIWALAATNSFLNNDGSEKVMERGWSNPCRQILIKLFCPELKAWHTHRMAQDSWRKSKTLTKAEIKAGKLIPCGEWVIDAKTKCRIPDGVVEINEAGEKKPTPGSGLEACWSKNSELFNAFGLPEGSSDLSAAMNNKTLVTIKLVSVPYEQDEKIKLAKFMPYKEKSKGADFEG